MPFLIIFLAVISQPEILSFLNSFFNCETGTPADTIAPKIISPLAPETGLKYAILILFRYFTRIEFLSQALSFSHRPESVKCNPRPS